MKEDSRECKRQWEEFLQVSLEDDDMVDIEEGWAAMYVYMLDNGVVKTEECYGICKEMIISNLKGVEVDSFEKY